MELEFKHVAAYLPYGLKLMSKSENESLEPNIYQLKSIDMSLKMVNFGWGEAKELTEIKPILRPLSDLKKEIEVNGENLVPIELLSFYANQQTESGKTGLEWGIINTFPYKDIILLLEWHFDIFGLIENNSAIDINTLAK